MLFLVKKGRHGSLAFIIKVGDGRLRYGGDGDDGRLKMRLS